ncbi:MAG: arginine--tRNA ligase, partial [Candidatus Gracilibacteria bacterium]|nr:arginine--tRNA ligase [Candidatus Gracilibacteria bacterium]
MLIKSKIIESINNLYFLNLEEKDITLENPPKKEFGDFAFSCFFLARDLKKAPNTIAEEVKNEFAKIDGFKNISTISGYVNFFVDDSLIFTDFQEINTEPKKSKNETVIIDYIGANVGKPLHIGHLCTPAQGQAIINLMKHLGYDVISDSHFGDWGGIFGKLITLFKLYFSIDNKKGYLNSEEVEVYENIYKIIKETTEITANSKPKTNEKIISLSEKLLAKTNEKIIDLEYLLNGYQLITIFSEENNIIDNQCRKEFQYLSGVGINLSNAEEKKRHETNIKLWKQFTSISITEVKKQLEILNIYPQYNIGESFYEGLNLPHPNDEDYPPLKYTMKDIVKELTDAKIATKNPDGSVGVIFGDETKIPSCVLQKTDGTGLYLTSDLSCIKYRMENWKPSKIIYFVDVRQQLHLKQCFTIAKKAWPELENVELFHAFNGFIKLKEGAMSTRKGTVIFLEDLINEGFVRTKNILEEKGKTLNDENIQKITIGAIKYSYLSQDREKDVVFDWDKALSFEGNSGPYIQYTFVRASRIIEKAGNFEKVTEIEDGIFGE